jgi:hypothetical protein
MKIPRALVLGLIMIVAQIAHASAPRTFVASYGNNANPCSLTAPCRSFNAAIAQVDPGGVVVVLDSAGYGPADISKSVSIVAPPGIYAGITVAPTGFNDGVFISVGNFNVTLRGLTITGSNGDPNGILAESSGTLNIDSCVIANTSRGIYVSASGALKLSVKDTLIRDTSGEGMNLAGDTGSIVGVVDGSRVERAGACGICASDASSIAVNNTVVDSSFAAGVRADTFSSLSTAFLTVTNSTITHSGGIGLFGFANHGTVNVSAKGNTIANNGGTGIAGSSFNGGLVTIVASRNTVHWNATGMDGNGSAFYSDVDNSVAGNGTNVTGPINTFGWQ